MRNQLKLIIFAIIAGTILTNGCSGQKTKPFEYHAADDMAEGPGVFSKDKGEFTVYDSNKNKSAENKAADSDVSAGQPHSDKMTSSQTTSTDSQPLDSTESFQQFKDWQRDQAEFKKFQQWKATKEGAEEYQEFLEWKRWQEYQRWQQRQTGQP